MNLPPRLDSPLARPVGSLCRWVEPLDSSASQARAARRMQEDEVSALPVTHEGLYFGMIREEDLVRMAAEGADEADPIGAAIRPGGPTVSPAEAGAVALRRMESSGQGVLPVVDAQGWCHGLITASALLSTPREIHRPRIVGGMATPSGVYLTNGAVGAGVHWTSLVLTGAILFSLFILGQSAAMWMALQLPERILVQPWVGPAVHATALALFLVGIRLLPLAGYHAAEHMVVHAIERGEELRPEIVRRMPRIHPRCGTNLAMGAAVFLGVFGSGLFPSPDLALLVAFLAALILWRPLGSLAQYWVTTRPPTDRQIEAGIRSGRALLARLQTESNRPPTVLQRIASSGILQIMAGSLVAQALLWLIMEALQVPAAFRPF
ncbi:MAG: DUF1385 domain-containing protein [Fimbriimonadaceae bacterium]|nr:DUF1385 domain-containing protein [Fimbriimonadaceae bacterium]